jgi:hypothetical protein
MKAYGIFYWGAMEISFVQCETKAPLYFVLKYKQMTN